MTITEMSHAEKRAHVLYEPVTGVFKTQHSIEENRAVAEQGLILLSEIGSTMHGVTLGSGQNSTDDMDEMGICIEAPEYVIGLDKFEQYEYRTQAVNARSGAGDIDRVIYSLRKFAKLAAAGNPTVLMPLFADEDKHLRYTNWAGDSLREHRDMFITKACGRKFLGYLDGQRKRYLDPLRQDSKHASRPELISQFGWDTKTGYHALRLAYQGQQLMNEGVISLPMSYEHRMFLLDVRNGKYTKEEVTLLIEEEERRLEAAMVNSALPEEPNLAVINAWLVSAYRETWALTYDRSVDL